MRLKEASEQSQWLAMAFATSSCFSLLVFPIGIILGGELFRAFCALISLPILIPLARAYFDARVTAEVCVIVAGLAPVIVIGVCTALAIGTVKLVYRREPLPKVDAAWVSHMKIAAVIFWTVATAHQVVVISASLSGN